MNNIYLGYSGNGGFGSTQYTCGSKYKHIFFVDTWNNSLYFSSSHSVSSSLAAGVIAAIVIGCLVAFICCVLIIVAIPICICCCLGVGIGAAASSGGTRYTYSNI